MNRFAKAARTGRLIGLAASIALTTAAFGQTADSSTDDGPTTTTGLDIPTNLQIFGKLDPNVRKPTAIVNDSVITGTDVDQRVALIEAASGAKVGGDELDRLRFQVLRGLIDETLQIQEAKANDIKVTPDEIKQSYDRIAKNFGKTPAQMHDYLRSIGSSDRSIRGQIEGELAWSRYLRHSVEPFINVGDEEVKAILDRLKAAKGTEEYHLKEIYLSATPDQSQTVFANARRMIEEIQKGTQPFEYFAHNFSEASTRAVNGDLDWVRLSRLPDSLSQAVQQMQVGQIAGPIQVPGGFSILYLVDKRQVLTADPRDAKLALRQLTVHFPEGTTQEQATARAAEFAKATQAIHGCGGVAAVAASINAEVVDNDSVRVRDLPPQLQEIMLKLQVGESTPPFGSAQEGVRALVLCGRDDPQNGALPRADQVQGQLEQERVNLRAQQMLRDLRRDAVVEYR